MCRSRNGPIAIACAHASFGVSRDTPFSVGSTIACAHASFGHWGVSRRPVFGSTIACAHTSFGVSRDTPFSVPQRRVRTYMPHGPIAIACAHASFGVSRDTPFSVGSTIACAHASFGVSRDAPFSGGCIVPVRVGAIKAVSASVPPLCPPLLTYVTDVKCVHLQTHTCPLHPLHPLHPFHNLACACTSPSISEGCICRRTLVRYKAVTSVSEVAAAPALAALVQVCPPRAVPPPPSTDDRRRGSPPSVTKPLAIPL